MPDYKKIMIAREAETEAARKATAAIVSDLQRAGYSLVIDWMVGNIEMEGNTIKYTAKNLSRVQGLYRLLAGFQKQFQGTMLGSVLEWTGKIIGLNQSYFESFTNPAETVADQARRLTLQRWGYNTATKELIPGGYMEGLFSNQEMARKIASLINQSIIQKIPLSQFQKAFRRAFVGLPGGAGMLEGHWNTNSFDLFQRIDRTANLIYADKLGLNYAIYSGTIMEHSRPKCIHDVNKVFSRKEINDFKNMEFQGKPKYGYDPFVDANGFNCRHHWSWISDGIAIHLRPELAKNK